MTISAQPTGFFTDFSRVRILRWISIAAVLGAVAVADSAEGGAVRRSVPGGYDGVWNVLIITQAGNCDAAYSYPFRVASGRISSAGAATGSGSVGPGGGGAVPHPARGVGGSGGGPPRGPGWAG